MIIMTIAAWSGKRTERSESTCYNNELNDNSRQINIKLSLTTHETDIDITSGKYKMFS